MSFILSPASCYPLVKLAIANYRAGQGFSNGTLRYLLSNNSNPYFSAVLPDKAVLQSGYRSLEFRYNKALCESPNFDHCADTDAYQSIANLNAFSYKLAPISQGGDLKRVGTKPIGIKEHEMKAWCAANGGIPGFLAVAKDTMQQQLKDLYRYLDKDLLQSLLNHSGTVPGNVAQVMPITYGGSGQITGFNPAWNYDIKNGLAQMGFNDNLAYIGGTYLDMAKKAAGGTIAPNANGLFMPIGGVGFENAYFDTALDEIYNDPNTAKILAVTPGLHKLVLWSESLTGWAHDVELAKEALSSEAAFRAFYASSTASNQLIRIPYYDPEYQIVWDLVVKAANNECAGFEYMMYLELHYLLVSPPFSDVFCGVGTYTGAFVLDACPPPIPTACPTRTVPDLDCLCFDMPEVANCSSILPGTQVQFNFTGGSPAAPHSFIGTYTGASTLTITNKATMAIFLQSLWQGSGYGQLIYKVATEQFKICNYTITTDITIDIPSCGVADLVLDLVACDGETLERSFNFEQSGEPLAQAPEAKAIAEPKLPKGTKSNRPNITFEV